MRRIQYWCQPDQRLKCLQNIQMMGRDESHRTWGGRSCCLPAWTASLESCPASVHISIASPSPFHAMVNDSGVSTSPAPLSVLPKPCSFNLLAHSRPPGPRMRPRLSPISPSENPRDDWSGCISPAPLPAFPSCARTDDSTPLRGRSGFSTFPGAVS